jgi:hypothetical protein
MNAIVRVEAGMRRRLPRCLLLSLPALLYVAVAATWEWSHIYRITGDEPHYLLITDSLVRDHDLFVYDNYLIDTPVHRAAGLDLSRPVHLSHLHNGFSIHGIGLPVLLMLPYRVGGPAGCRVFMAIMSGLIPFLVYRGASPLLSSRKLRAGLAVSLAVGLPFVAASNQLYPDLVGGMLILYLAGTVAAMLREGSHGSVPPSHYAVFVVVAVLPWFHMRLMAPAVLLLLAYLWATVGRKRLLAVALPVIGVAGSFAMLAAYNRAAFGHARGPYGPESLSVDPRQVGMILLGLHFDEAQGMFMQQPLLLLGLVGLVPLLRRDWRLGVLIGLVYGSVLVPNAMHLNWYGGYCFGGRFAWAGILLWTFPLAAAIDASTKGERFWLLILASSIAFQALLATRWIRTDALLIADLDMPAWVPRGVYASLLPASWLRLPSFEDFDTYLRHPGNWASALGGLLLVTSGWLRRRGGRRLVVMTWATYALAGLLLVAVVPPVLRPWSISAARLSGVTGREDGTARTAVQDRDGEGYLTLGPYLALSPGRYEATVRYGWDGRPSLSPARWEIAFGPRLVADGDMPPSAANGGVLTRVFLVRRSLSAAHGFQFRVRYPGHDRLSVRGLTLTPLAREADSRMLADTRR